MCPAFIHVDVRHVTGALSHDPLRLPVCCAARVDRRPAVQPEMCEQARDRMAADIPTALFQLEGDS